MVRCILQIFKAELFRNNLIQSLRSKVGLLVLIHYIVSFMLMTYVKDSQLTSILFNLKKVSFGFDVFNENAGINSL